MFHIILIKYTITKSIYVSAIPLFHSGLEYISGEVMNSDNKLTMDNNQIHITNWRFISVCIVYCVKYRMYGSFIV